MAPVFAYRWQLWLFVVVMALLAVFPLVDKPSWMNRAVLYRALKLNDNYRYNIMPQLINGKRDIDVLFLGASALGSGFNPRMVKEALREKLGREPVVYTMYHPQRGADLDAIIIRDILSKRRVTMLVWEALRAQRRDNGAHAGSNFLWDYALHKNMLAASDIDDMSVYLYSMMNALKLSLSPVLDMKGKSFPETVFLCDRIHQLGACLRNVGNENKKIAGIAPPSIPLERMLHFRDKAEQDLDISRHYKRSSQIFIGEGLRVAEQYGAFVAFTQIPMMSDGNYISLYSFREGHPANEVPILAVPRPDLFTDRVSQRKYFMPGDGTHLSSQGTNFHTQAALPALLALYDMALEAQESAEGER